MFTASTNSSTTTLTSPPPPKKAQSKNYEAAFGALSATYGLAPGPLMPTPPPTTHTIQRSDVSSNTTTRAPVTAPSHTQKDYNAAFGSLVSSYGFGSTQLPRSSTSK